MEGLGDSNVNMNEVVWVKLTPEGKKFLNKATLMHDEHITSEEHSGEFHMWRLMQVFGPAIYTGMPEPLFEKNEIYFAKPVGFE